MELSNLKGKHSNQKLSKIYVSDFWSNAQLKEEVQIDQQIEEISQFLRANFSQFAEIKNIEVQFSEILYNKPVAYITFVGEIQISLIQDKIQFYVRFIPQNSIQIEEKLENHEENFLLKLQQNPKYGYKSYVRLTRGVRQIPRQNFRKSRNLTYNHKRSRQQQQQNRRNINIRLIQQQQNNQISQNQINNTNQSQQLQFFNQSPIMRSPQYIQYNFIRRRQYQPRHHENVETNDFTYEDREYSDIICSQIYEYERKFEKKPDKKYNKQQRNKHRFN